MSDLTALLAHAPFVTSFRDIRERRNLTREALAGLAGVASGTIANLEAGRTRAPKPSKAERIAESIIEKLPLEDDELLVLAQALDIQPIQLRRTQQQLSARPARQTDPQRERLYRAVDEMIQTYGIESVRIAVEIGMRIGLQALHDEEEKRPQPRTTTVKHPPVQRDGYVEEVEIEYEDLGGVDDEPAKPDTARKVPPRKRTKGA